MDIFVEPHLAELDGQFAALLDDPEVAAIIRRSGLTPRGAGPDAGPAAGEMRETVQAALVDLGASTLLLPERHGGRDLGQQGAVVLAERLGRVLYQGPLPDTLTATDLAVRVGAAAEELLTRIAGGGTVSLAVREHAESPSDPAPARFDEEAGTVTAVRRFVVADAGHLLVVGRDGGGLRAALVDRDDPTVRLRPHDDVGRGRLCAVRMDGTPVLPPSLPAAAVTAAWPGVLAAARVRHAAYLVGLGQAALDLAVGYARSRRQFGRPIGRFQAPAFGLAELATRLEATRWLVRATAWECDSGEDIRLGSRQALAMAADVAAAATLGTMQVHGAYGTTEDSDAQLFYRRAAIERVWLGTPTELRAEAVPLLRSRVEV